MPRTLGRDCIYKVVDMKDSQGHLKLRGWHERYSPAAIRKDLELPTLWFQEFVIPEVWKTNVCFFKAIWLTISMKTHEKPSTVRDYCMSEEMWFPNEVSTTRERMNSVIWDLENTRFQRSCRRKETKRGSLETGNRTSLEPSRECELLKCERISFSKGKEIHQVLQISR